MTPGTDDVLPALLGLSALARRIVSLPTEEKDKPS